MRRAHKKTRTGCGACKRRRVKCDERKPSCLNCERNKLPCSLEFLTPAAPTGSKALFSVACRPLLDRSIEPLSLGPELRELLHHYMTTTSWTLGAAENMVVWQQRIPSIAYSTDFLMHGMLAVSALHLAHLKPSRRVELVRRASGLKHLAFSSYWRCLGVRDPRAVSGALAFGGFVLQYASALSVGELGTIPSLDNRNAHWFHLSRGLVKLMLLSWTELTRGPLAKLLEYQPDIGTHPYDGRLTKVHQLLDEMDDEQAMIVCRETLEQLRRAAAAATCFGRADDIPGVLHLWTGIVSQNFVVLLHERLPEALVILAHYCALMNMSEPSWYIGDNGKQLLIKIEKTLEPDYAQWIQWAMDFPDGEFLG